MNEVMNSTNVTNISVWCDVAIVPVRKAETWEYLRFQQRRTEDSG